MPTTTRPAGGSRSPRRSRISSRGTSSARSSIGDYGTTPSTASCSTTPASNTVGRHRLRHGQRGLEQRRGDRDRRQPVGGQPGRGQPDRHHLRRHGARAQRDRRRRIVNAPANVIGGTTSAAANVIAGNADGVHLSGSGTRATRGATWSRATSSAPTRAAPTSSATRATASRSTATPRTTPSAARSPAQANTIADNGGARRGRLLGRREQHPLRLDVSNARGGHRAGRLRQRRPGLRRRSRR